MEIETRHFVSISHFDKVKEQVLQLGPSSCVTQSDESLYGLITGILFAPKLTLMPWMSWVCEPQRASQSDPLCASAWLTYNKASRQVCMRRFTGDSPSEVGASLAIDK